MTFSPPPFVTVVSGVPRSGTSLMMRMLRAGGLALLADDHRPPDDDNPEGYFEYEPVRRLPGDVGWLDGAVGRAVKVVHALAPLLPDDHEYRVIVMRRGLGAVLASQRRMLERGGDHSEDLPDERLAEIFTAQISALERWAAARRRVGLLVVDYDSLVARPERTARSVADFLDLPLDVEAMVAELSERRRPKR